MNRTAIETCDLTWNPLTGCTHNCEREFGFPCYARAITRRFPARYPQGFAPTWWEERLEEPLRRRKPALIMVCSMGDLFADGQEWAAARVLQVIREAKQHTFQLFTKNARGLLRFTFPANCWAGVSVPAQKALDGALDALARVQAPVRFISFEPLMEPIALPRGTLPIEWAIIGGLSGELTPRPPSPRAVWAWDLLTELLYGPRDQDVRVWVKSSLAAAAPRLRGYQMWPRGFIRSK